MANQDWRTSVMKKLLFGGEGLMAATLNGKKEITLRKYRKGAHDFTRDEFFIGSFEEGLDILLFAMADTSLTFTFGDLPDSIAREDGFQDSTDMFEQMKGYYPDLQKTDRVAIIRYRKVLDNGAPVTAPNR